MLGYADRCFMSATANCTLVTLLALCLVVAIILAIVASHGFRNVGPCPVLAKRSQINIFWNSSREGVENSPCRVAFSVFQSLCTCNVAESYQVFFRYLKWQTKYHSLGQFLGHTESSEVNILGGSQSIHCLGVVRSYNPFPPYVEFHGQC